MLWNIVWRATQHNLCCRWL